MPEGCDVIITVGSEEKACIVKERCEGMPYNIDVRVIENRGRDVSALLVGAGKDVLNYDLVCFAHDKKVRQLRPETIGDGFAKKCFENTLASKAYVANIINLFADNPRLGVAMPSAPNHADYFYSYAFSWGPNYRGTKDLLDGLGIKVPLSPHADVIAPLGTMFWFRPKALHGLIDKSWEYSDFPPEPNPADGSFLHFVERAYCYVAQSNGYYSEYILSDRFARLEIINLAFETRELAKAIGPTLARPTLLETCRNASASQGLRATIVRNVKGLIKQNAALTKMALSARHLLGKDPVVHRHEIDPAKDNK